MDLLLALMGTDQGRGEQGLGEIPVGVRVDGSKNRRGTIKGNERDLNQPAFHRVAGVSDSIFASANDRCGSPIAPLNSRFRFVRPAASDTKLLENAGPEQDRSRGRADPSSNSSALDVELPPERLHLLASRRSVFQREPVLHGSKARIHEMFVY